MLNNVVFPALGFPARAILDDTLALIPEMHEKYPGPDFSKWQVE